MGRKPLGDSGKTAWLKVRISESDATRIDSAASKAGKTTSEWVRGIVLDAAETVLQEPGKVDTIAQGKPATKRKAP